MPTIRPAELADVPAIVAIHRADIVAWKRWDENGDEHLADYGALSTYERWQNGGPWLDESTYAPYLARLLAPGSGGLALVAEADGQLRAVAEATLGEEPRPYGHYLDVSALYTLRGHAGRGLGSALMAAMEERARQAGCSTLLVTNAEAPGFYARHGLQHAETWRRVRLRARAGQTQYTAEAFEPGHYDTVRGWMMPVGRYQSGRQEWERIRPGAEPDFEAWRGLRKERWRMEARRTQAVLALDEVPRKPGTADVHLWLEPGGPLGAQALGRHMLAAITDRAARCGFSALNFFVAETTLAHLTAGWHSDGYKQELWLRSLVSAGTDHQTATSAY